jgi:basic membrane protein A
VHTLIDKSKKSDYTEDTKPKEEIPMKKVLALLLSLALCMTAFAALAEDMRVAMITDYGDITDQSFNQTTYEAAKAYCEANGVDFTYYKPAGDSTAERVAMVEKAVDEDYNVLVLPGYAFGETIAEVQGEYPDTKFVALDVSAGDLGGAEPASNVYCAVYQEELCGYMAGYAAVKLGYTHLGFLGGMAVPAVVRYGFGFVQGADAAAKETGANAEHGEYDSEPFHVPAEAFLDACFNVVERAA